MDGCASSLNVFERLARTVYRIDYHGTPDRTRASEPVPYHSSFHPQPSDGLFFPSIDNFYLRRQRPERIQRRPESGPAGHSPRPCPRFGPLPFPPRCRHRGLYGHSRCHGRIRRLRRRPRGSAPRCRFDRRYRLGYGNPRIRRLLPLLRL